MSVRLEIATDATRFAEIRNAWNELWKKSGTYIFQTHDWLSGWINGVDDRREIRLLIGLAWDSDRLIGIMPLAVHRRLGLRILQWAGQLFSDYCDCLVDPTHDAMDILDKLWAQVRRQGKFDIAILQQVRPDAQCRRFLESVVNEGTQLHHATRVDRCMRIDNQWPNGEAFFRSLPKKGRNNHTRGKRILGELGGEVAFQIIEPGQPTRAVIDQILELKMTWLKTADPKSSLLGIDGKVQRSIIDKAWETGLTKIFLLTYGGKIAAASINFVYPDRMEAYLTSYDAACERASPGTILIVEYAQWSFDRGLKHVDFLRGDEAFKFRLANAETIITGFRGSQTLVGQFAESGRRWMARRRQQPDTTSHDQPDIMAAVG